MLKEYSKLQFANVTEMFSASVIDDHHFTSSGKLFACIDEEDKYMIDPKYLSAYLEEMANY